MRIDWKSLRTFVANTNLYKQLNYLQLPTSYYAWIYYEGESFSTSIDIGSAECEDFIANFKTQAIVKNDLSEDGVTMTRTTFVGRSRTLHCFFVAFDTSTLTHDDKTGFISIKMKDATGAITTEGNQAVITEIDFCPGETVAYSLYGGGLESIDTLDCTMFVDAILAPDIAERANGSTYFIRNKMLCNPKEAFFRNAINAGDIPGIKGYNILRVIIRHEKGVQKKLQSEIQYYV